MLVSTPVLLVLLGGLHLPAIAYSAELIPVLPLGHGQLSENDNDNTCKTYINYYLGEYQFCPDQQIFHPGLKQCVFQDSYDCVCQPPACTRPTCGGVVGQVIPDKTNCSRYYYCDRGYPLRRECPPGYLFNSDLKTCESRSTTKYHCPWDIQCPQTNGRFANTRDPECRTYLDCTNGQAVIVNCDRDYVYYSKLDKCVLPDSYNCSQPQFQCPEKDKDFADPNDSRRFFYCMGDAPLHRWCPQETAFKTDVGRCE